MAQTNTKALIPKNRQEVSSYLEPANDSIVFTPDVDILESDRKITLLADMPGVNKEDLKINLHNGVLTLEGEIAPWSSTDENDILIEYEPGRFHRQFKIAEIIDEEHIDAQLNDGVLRLTLPKDENAIPYKIPVKAG